MTPKNLRKYMWIYYTLMALSLEVINLEKSETRCRIVAKYWTSQTMFKRKHTFFNFLESCEFDYFFRFVLFSQLWRSMPAVIRRSAVCSSLDFSGNLRVFHFHGFSNLISDNSVDGNQTQIARRKGRSDALIWSWRKDMKQVQDLIG